MKLLLDMVTVHHFTYLFLVLGVDGMSSVSSSSRTMSTISTLLKERNCTSLEDCLQFQWYRDAVEENDDKVENSFSSSGSPPAVLLATQGFPKKKYPLDGIKNAVLKAPLDNVEVSHPQICNLANPWSECKIKNMPYNQIKAVAPGGDTRCIITHQSPYMFYVIPRDPHKLLFVFEGGGLCVTEMSTIGPWSPNGATPDCNRGMFSDNLVITSSGLEYGLGIYNHEDPNNVFNNHTIVFVPYCSGDYHIGSTTYPWKDSQGVEVKAHGFFNTLSALEWIKHQNQGPYDSLAITGASAGALASIWWSPAIYSTLAVKPGGTKTTIIDSLYMTFFDTAISKFLALIWNSCYLPIGYCGPNGKPRIFTDVLAEIIGTHRDVAFMAISAKDDDILKPATETTLREVRRSLKNPWMKSLASQAALDLSKEEDAIGESYMNKLYTFLFKLKHPNMVNFIVDGTHHMYTHRDATMYRNTRYWPSMSSVPPIQGSCAEGSMQVCPGSSQGAYCQGSMCCPPADGLAGNLTFPCPSASSNFKGCQLKRKITDCLEPPLRLHDWLSQSQDIYEEYAAPVISSQCHGQFWPKSKWGKLTNLTTVDLFTKDMQVCAAELAGDKLQVDQSNTARPRPFCWTCGSRALAAHRVGLQWRARARARLKAEAQMLRAEAQARARVTGELW